MKKLQAEILKCNKCKVKRQIKTPFIGLGNLNARVMLVCERPGYHTRIIHGITLAGNRSGDFFMKCLEHIGVSINEVYITNLVKCQDEYNRTPDNTDINACKGYLERELELIKPETVVLMGRIALNHFFIMHTVLKNAGKVLFDKNFQRFYILPHPAWALRTGEEIQYKKWFEKIKEFI